MPGQLPLLATREFVGEKRSQDLVVGTGVERHGADWENVVGLSSVFVAAGATADSPDEQLEAELVSAWELGSLAHPSVHVTKTDFAAYVGSRVETSSELLGLAIEDLYLSCACAAGDPTAMTAFEARYGPEIGLALSKVPDALPMADEITQLILAQVLLPDDKGQRGIVSYRGRGGLFSWLRVVTVRRALRELSKQQRETPLGDEQILASLQPATDLSYMKEVYRDAFRVAFTSALAELDYDARVLLRHHYVHELSIDKLSLLHKVHRATAARRLAKSREMLLQSTRRRLLTDLRVTTEELDSIMRLIASKLEGSIGGLMSSEDCAASSGT